MPSLREATILLWLLCVNDYNRQFHRIPRRRTINLCFVCPQQSFTWLWYYLKTWTLDGSAISVNFSVTNMVTSFQTFFFLWFWIISMFNPWKFCGNEKQMIKSIQREKTKTTMSTGKENLPFTLGSEELRLIYTGEKLLCLPALNHRNLRVLLWLKIINF